jgi:hypothetical protein
MMFSNSFTGFLLSVAISAFWLAVSLSTGQYFIALGSIFFLALAMLMELPDSSSEEGSSHNDDDSRAP